jgi:hypothetical protein
LYLYLILIPSYGASPWSFRNLPRTFAEEGLKTGVGEMGGPLEVTEFDCVCNDVVEMANETLQQGVWPTGTDKIGSYSVYGSKGLVGSTYTRNIFLLEAPKSAKSLSGFQTLIKSFEREALDAGADRISIFGASVINDGFLNPSLAARYGYSFSESSNGVFLFKILK